ncbi:nucleotidyltransferase family protein [Winogradskyella ursingii]|uniref:nucleotidyltransferase family protein n=1 Tax=Winogradskyella ursingii TaxID=2686079 RepID=UPI0015CABA32|nr:nucleotidyltransferase family protein [Winogradskyella ursingii]
MKIAILILAAGKSSRMGQPKQLLAIDGTNLLGKTIEHALESKANKVTVVLGYKADIIEKEIKNKTVEIIINHDFESGLSSSIVAGIKAIKDVDAVLITLADQPKVDKIYLNKMISKFTEQSEFVIASNYNGSIGVPAIFSKAYFQQLLMLSGDKGAKQLLNSKEIKVKTVDASVDLLDIDTLEDYKNLANK